MTGPSEKPPEQQTRVGPYRLLDRIGIGGMAEVFVARHADANANAPSVVVKRMLPSLTRDAAALTMFRDEARLGGQLVHPNIVRVLEDGQDANGAYIVLEHIDGLDAGELTLALVDLHLRRASRA